MISPDKAHYLAAAEGNACVPLRARIPADLETPVSVFMKLQPLGAVFLLESVERGVQVGRYTFVGLGVRTVISLQDGQVTTTRHCGDAAQTQTRPLAGHDPLTPVRQELEHAPRPAAGDRELPPPFGGAVGYLGYDLVRDFEAIPLPTTGGPGLPDYRFLFPRTMVVFDHVQNQIEVLNIPADGDPGAAYAAASQEIDGVLAALGAPLEIPVPGGRAPTSDPQGDPVQGLESEISQAEFEDMVTRAQEHILAGDAFQIVLSQRLRGRTSESPFQVYRALRSLNPSPYLFFLDCGDFQLIGSSPEMLVRLEGDTLQVNPIAGTRPRGGTAAEDARLAAELLADEKERAEHVMLVDLGRNDLGRVCRTGTVQVDEFMAVERYSHVMHLVSRVSGRMEAGLDMFDALRAVFPAGTVSGAPKIRAMQIISELEDRRRGPYAGAVGYFGQRGDMDMCITIRTLLMQGKEFSVQAGAGIVADSVPANEYRETQAKIRALTRAVRIAEEGL